MNKNTDNHVDNGASNASKLRVLAVDPGTRHMGIGVLVGSGLVYYTVKDMRRQRPADELIRATRATLTDLVKRYEIAILAYEKTFYVQQKTSALLHVQEMEIARVGRAMGLRVVGLSPGHVRKMLCGDGRATKLGVATALVRRFPELQRYLTSGGGRREAYWLNMFDAVAVAVVCASEPGLTASEAA